MKRFLHVLFALSFINACAQNEYKDDWTQTVQWDGVTHWSRYMLTYPGSMGPNALPIPFIQEGSVDSVNAFSISATRHMMKGDKTTNLAFYFNHAIVKDVISIDLFMVPQEWFSMSREVKLERRIPPHHYNDRSAMGDLHGHVNFQLLNKLRDRIHLQFRAGMRFPTSDKLGSARFTDMPGYFFDLTAAKPLNNGWKIFGNTGFYVWEAIDKKLNRQDDAFLFGAGISYSNKKQVHFQTAVSGYLGYMEHQLDKPIVARMSLSKTWERYRSFIRFQHGIKHFKYTSVEMGGGYVFKWKTKRISNR